VRTPETYPLEGESEDIEARLSYLGLLGVYTAQKKQTKVEVSFGYTFGKEPPDFLPVNRPLHTASVVRHLFKDCRDCNDLLIDESVK